MDSTFMIAKNAFVQEAAGSLLSAVNWRSILIFGLTLLGIMKFKIHPALMIIISAVLGIVFFMWI
jgi:hypothetical protein